MILSFKYPKEKETSLLRVFLYMIFALNLSACVSISNKNLEKTVSISNETFIYLNFYSWPSNLILTQRMFVERQNETHELLIQTEITDNKLVMVGLTPNGLDLFSITWRKHGQIEYKKRSFIPDGLQPEFILADFLISHLPDNILESQMINGKLNVSTKKTIQLREILNLNNKKIISATIDLGKIWPNKITFLHHVRQYKLILETLSVTNLDLDN